MIEASFKSGINDLTTDGVYQWDYNQYLSISGIDFNNIAPNVHFANKKSNNAIVMSSMFENGKVVCQIPNSLLNERYDILAYIYVADGLSAKTIKTIRIPITARAEPSVGMATPSDDEIHEIVELELQAKLILDGLTVTNYSNTATYNRPNMVFYQNKVYMCVYDGEISGISPDSVTDKWKLMCYGSVVTNVGINDNGKLEFTFDNGNKYQIDFTTVSATSSDYIDRALLSDRALTADVSDKVKVIDIPITDNKAQITKPGLYVCYIASGYGSRDYSVSVPIFQDSIEYGVICDTVFEVHGTEKSVVRFSGSTLKVVGTGYLYICKLVTEF